MIVLQTCKWWEKNGLIGDAASNDDTNDPESNTRPIFSLWLTASLLYIFFFFWTVIHRWSIVVVAIAADCYFRRVNIASWMTRSKSSIEIANEETWPLIIFGRKHIRVARYVLHVKIYTDSFFRIEERKKKKIKKRKEVRYNAGNANVDNNFEKFMNDKWVCSIVFSPPPPPLPLLCA